MTYSGIVTKIATAAVLSVSLYSVANAQEWLDKLEPRVLKLADFSGNQDYVFGASMVKWEAAITEFTKGKITFENYWSASLLNATNTLQGVGDGVADIGLVIPSYYPKQMPVASWFFGFGAALSGSTVHDVAAGGATSTEFGLTYKPLIDEYASHNIKLLHANATPSYNLLCNTPINSLADAKGKRARAVGAVWSGAVEAIGMTPVAIAFNEAYEGLQRGVFDCMVINPHQLVSGAIFKAVAPEYVPVTTAQLQASVWTMNLDTWNSFPKELQDFITEQNIIAVANIWRGYLSLEAKVGDAITAGEVRVNNAAELEPLVSEQRSKFVAGMAENAPAALTDVPGLIKSYQERIAYWTKALVDGGHPIVERNPEAIVKAFVALSTVNIDPFVQRYEAEMLPKFLGK